MPAQWDEQSLRRIVRSVLATERMNLSTPTGWKRPRGHAGGSLLGKTVGEVSAATWGDPAVLGSGPVQVYRQKDATASGTLESVSGQQTWYNVVPEVIPLGKIVIATMVLGRPTIILESCEPAGGGSASGGEVSEAATITVSSSYFATASDQVILCDATAGGFTVTLPTASMATGQLMYIKKTDTSGNVVTVDGAGAETVDDSLTQALNAYNAITITSDASKWWIL